MMKLALALLLALFSADTFASIGARSLPLRGLLVDGINRRMPIHRREKQGKAVSRAKYTGLGRGKTIGSKLPANPSGMLPVVLPAPTTVREIDADGLRKLLQRGEAGAARPLLVNFWATWCVPCRKEFPDLVKIDSEYRGRALEFVIVSADDVSDIKTGVPKFLREMRAMMPAYLLNATDTQAAIAQVDPTWGGELPATFLFDRQGKLIYKHTGLIDAAELREALEKVIGDK